MGSCQSPQWGWWSAGCADQPPWCGYPVLSQPYSSHSSPFSGGRRVWSLIRSLLGNHPQNHGNRAASLPHTNDGCCPASHGLSSPGNFESSLPCPSLTMVELSIGKVEFEPTWCNEELMSSIWGGKPKQNNNKKSVSAEASCAPKLEKCWKSSVRAQ